MLNFENLTPQEFWAICYFAVFLGMYVGFIFDAVVDYMSSKSQSASSSLKKDH